MVYPPRVEKNMKKTIIIFEKMISVFFCQDKNFESISLTLPLASTTRKVNSL